MSSPALPADVPSPAPRMWSTWLRRPRNVDRFAPPIPIGEMLARLPERGEAERWGEVRLLIDYVAVLHADGTLTNRFRLVTMPFDPDHVREWGEWVGEFDPRIAKRFVRRAVVRGPRGDVPARVEYERIAPTSHVHRVRFAGLVPGAVVEIEEQSDQFVPYAVAPGLWDQAYLAGPLPVHRLRFTVAIAPPFVPRFALHHAAPPPVESDVDGYRVLRWDVRDQPGIEFDERTPHLRDVVPWVDVSTLPSWESVAAFHRRDLEPHRPDSRSLDALAAGLVAGATTERDRAMRIHRYATLELGDGREPGEHRPATRSTRRVVEELRGDCKDKAVLVVGLLRAVGIEADVALVLTAHSGLTPFLPGPRFDHALVRARVDGADVWMDLVGGPYTFGSLPPTNGGLPALLLDGTATVTPVAEPADHGADVTATGTLDADGTLRLVVEQTLRGTQAARAREFHRAAPPSQRGRRLSSSIRRTYRAARLDEAWFEGLDDLERDVRLGFTLVLPHWLRTVGELRLFDLPDLGPAPPWDVLPAEDRESPFRLPPPGIVRERFRITLPPGFTGDPPEPVASECDWMHVSAHAEIDGETFVLDRTIECRGGTVPPDRIAEFRAACSDHTHLGRDLVLRGRPGDESPKQ